VNDKFPACEIKRVFEVCASGLYKSEALLSEGEDIRRRHRTAPYCEAIRFAAEGGALPSGLSNDDYRRDMERKLEWRDLIKTESASDNPVFREWRKRQMARCLLELGESQTNHITYVPGAFELAQGCSVNCWFCALDAPPLTGLYRYTPEHAALWSEIQTAMKDTLGKGARWSSLYWATEPLDNPDMEAFCEDFHRIHGMYPQTTTAVPLRDVERTKALLKNSFSKGCLVNRFSVHSGEQLVAIHENFTAEELANTELLLENPENPIAMVRAGRLYNLDERDPELAKRENKRTLDALKKENPAIAEHLEKAVINVCYLSEEKVEGIRVNIPNSIACICGFLIRMIPGTVELIAPCAADDDWPMGYMVFDRRYFSDARDFRIALDELIRDNMPEHVTAEDDVAFSKRVNFTCLENGFSLSTVFGKITYAGDRIGQYLLHLGNALNEGRHKAGWLAVECFYLFGFPEKMTLALLDAIFKKGLLQTKTEPDLRPKA
jgi:radical SAM family RiPP maturation amino acid epimerase